MSRQKQKHKKHCYSSKIKNWLRKQLRKAQTDNVILKEFTIEEMQSRLANQQFKFKIQENITLRPRLYKVFFFIKHHQCQGCQIFGTKFLLRYSKHYGVHIALLSDCGKEMTIDHKTPKSKNGKNNTNNYQTLCYSCNACKRDLDLDEETTRIYIKLLKYLEIKKNTKMLKQIENIIDKDCPNIFTNDNKKQEEIPPVTPKVNPQKVGYVAAKRWSFPLNQEQEERLNTLFGEGAYELLCDKTRV